MKNSIVYIIIIGVIGWCFAGYQMYEKHQVKKQTVLLSEEIEKKENVLRDSLPKFSEKIAIASVAFQKKEAEDKKKDSTKPQTSIIGKMDTVERALLKQTRAEFAIERKGLKDSLNFFRQQYFKTYASLNIQKERLKNLSVVQVNQKYVSNPSADNASINFYEFQSQRNPGSWFSPMRNYMRITNNIDSGKVNGKPYFDIELANDQIYQIMFQARTSYAFGTQRATVGLGAELKLNNVSFNVVGSIGSKGPVMQVENPFNRSRFGVTVGLRYDFAKIMLQ